LRIYTLELGTDVAMASKLRRIEELLAERIGLSSMSVGSGLIFRAVQRRTAALGFDNLSAYERLLRESAAEIQSLAEEVVVPESWFFRDARAYQWFRGYVQHRWLHQPERPPARVLSFACASGEEPYSIAMTMSDLGLPASRFRIDAVDISSRCLAKARQGVYGATAFRGSDLSYRSHFFREHPEGFEINPAIRSMVRFFQANVLDSRWLEGLTTYHVIFCRNLLIYLNPAARAAVSTALNRLLGDDGVVVIGHADRFEWNGTEPTFTALGEPGCFAYARTVPVLASQPRCQPEPTMTMPDLAVAASSAQAAAPMPSPSQVITTGAPDAAVMPSAVRTDEQGSLLSRAAELANQGRHSEAISTCKRDLQLKGHTASAYYLLGMIYQAQSDYRQAEACFHKTVYLDPNHDEALLALALLAARRGEHKLAGDFRRRAVRIATMTRNRAT
jgi:chemotaxis protein methyltransferase WspC